MKKLISIISLTVISLCLLLLTSCGKTVNEVGNLKVDADTLVLSWDRVQGAKTYTVTVSGSDFEKNTKDNKYSLEYLEPGTYEIKIRANGDGIEKKDSDWVCFTFVREKESGLRYKLINNNTEYQLISLGTASGDVVMDDFYRGKPVTSIAEKAFSGNTRITSFVVGKNVKTIGASAFARCSELTSITIPEGVTSIGKSCFQSCKKLTSFAFPSTVTKVEDYIFSWCTALESVTFGDDVDTVSVYAFSNCKALKSVVFSDALKSIGEYAFSDCEALESADFGNSLEYIGPYAFYNCVKLTELNIGESIKTIDEYAFGNCDGFTSFTVPESCEKIMSCAFRYCDNLEEVILGESLTYIGAGAFYNTKIYNDAETHLIIGGWYLNCRDREITSVSIPAGVYGIADSAFYGCKKLTQVTLPGIRYICNSAFYGCEALTMARFDSSLLSIGDYSFKNCKSLMYVIYGSKLEKIGDYAFSGCSKLQPMKISQDNAQTITTFPSTLTSIGTGAFNKINVQTEGGLVYVGGWLVGTNLGQSNALQSINVKAGTIGIANYAFYQISVVPADDLKGYAITIPASVKHIGRGAFYQVATYQDKKVTVSPLSEGLLTIGDYAFYGNFNAYFGGNTRALVIPETTEYIGRSAFYGCEDIYSLSVPESVKSISPYAFYGCKNLGADIPAEKEGDDPTPGYLILSEGIETISEKAFYGCYSIKTLVLPDTLTTLGARAFYKCTGIESLTIGSSLTRIPDYAFYNAEKLTTLVIPEGVTEIGNYAFKGCENLTSLTIAGTVESIGNYAFYNAKSLPSLNIPEGVKFIGKHAFRGMNAAKSIIIPATVTDIMAHAFYGANNTMIYVCQGADTTNWDVRWNSSYAPVFTDVTLSEDKTYVVSFVKGEKNPDNLISSEAKYYYPLRDGYNFVGFATEAGATEAKYTMETVRKASNGTVLYVVWAAK